MKKSRIIIITLIIGISLFYSGALYINNGSIETVLINSFSKSYAKIITTEIYFTGTVSSNNIKGDKKVFLENFANRIGILKDEAYLLHQVNNDSIKKMEISGVTKENLAIDINLQLDDASSGNKNTITVAVTQYGEAKVLTEFKKKVSKVLRKYKIKTRVNTSITGTIDGKYDNSRMNGICDNILEAIEAQNVDKTWDRNLLSVSAYSRGLGSTLRVNGKRMNLNLAIRYNSLENKTYIWLATPVITTEY